MLELASGLLPAFWGPSSSPELLQQHMEQLQEAWPDSAGLEKDRGLWLRHNNPRHSGVSGRDACDTLPECSLFFASLSLSIHVFFFFYFHLLSVFLPPFFLLPQSSSQSAPGCEGPCCFLISDITSRILFFTLSSLVEQNHSRLFECIWGKDHDKTDTRFYPKNYNY